MSDEQNKRITLDMFDPWLKDDGPAALVLREHLVSVEGKDAVIFPPTYPMEEAGPRVTTSRHGEYRITVELPPHKEQKKEKKEEREEKAGYNIDHHPDGTISCQIDSVGSQANRMEPVFKRDAYCKLVPQITIKAGEKKKVNLLDANHRAADAIVRFSALGGELWDAFKALERGDAEPLARIAPTSLLFGAWDSRATQAKVPRILRSVIRAYGVTELTRSAHFNPSADYVKDGLIDEELDKGKGKENPLSKEGMKDNPAPRSHGGIQAREIVRNACINLVALRSLGVARGSNPTGGSGLGDPALKLRRYILGLALVAFSGRDPGQYNLREGCLLRPDPDRPAEWAEVPFEGKEKPLNLGPPEMARYAQAAADAFGVIAPREVTFDSKTANKWLSLLPAEREKRKSKAPVVRQEFPE